MIDYSKMAFPKPGKTTKVIKPIAKIGKLTKERVKLFGTETALFETIWNSREHVCEMCGKHIPEMLTYCFAHILPKGSYKAYRYMPENIRLVCSIPCHENVDRLYRGEKKLEFENYLKSIKSSKTLGQSPKD